MRTSTKVGDRLRVLNSNNAVVIKSKPTEHHDLYNCWGFVAYAKGWIAKPVWLQEDEIDALLEEHTRKINKVRVGDIAVYKFRNGVISHAAIVTDPVSDEILHKPGSMPLEVTKIGIGRWPAWESSSSVTYRRDKNAP